MQLPPTEQPERGAPRPVNPQTYDVFLSHRGPDVKLHFCEFLENELKRAGVRTFVDKSDLVIGDAAWDTMQHALATAKLVVPIISSGFVESEFCLAELELMMRKPANVLPVFYDAWPGIAALEEQLCR